MKNRRPWRERLALWIAPGLSAEIHDLRLHSTFALFKNSVRGAHHNVSAKYLPNYLDEYSFRWNHRKDATPIFWTILDRAQKDRPAAA